MNIHVVFFSVNNANRNIRAVIRNSFKIRQQVCPHEACLYRAIALFKSCNVIVSKLLFQTVDNLFKRFYGSCRFNRIVHKSIVRYGKNFRTLVCSSPDFRNGKTLIYLASLYAEDESNIDFEKLCRNTGCGNDLINLLAFDLIIMNEDRHNSNVGFLMSDNGELKLSPIYDNGYSLLYDDIKGLLNDFKSAYKYCLCNAPLYEERFNAAERIFQKMSKIYVPTINLNIERNQVADRVMAVKKTYNELVYADINNIELKDIWWEKVVDFIMWRIEYVRNLRDSVAE